MRVSIMLLELSRNRLTKEDVKDLWARKSKDWHIARAKEWCRLEKECFSNQGYSKEELERIEEFFLTGTYTGYISNMTKFSLIPFETKEEAWQVFDSKLFDYHDRCNLTNYLFNSNLHYFSYAKEHVRFFVEAVLVTPFRPIQEEREQYGCFDIVSDNPEDWVVGFLSSSANLMRYENRTVYYVEGFDYFLEAFKNIKETTRSHEKLRKRFFKHYNRIKDDGSDNPCVIELHQKFTEHFDEVLELWDRMDNLVK